MRVRQAMVALVLILGACSSTSVKAVSSTRLKAFLGGQCSDVYNGTHKITEAEKGTCVTADGTVSYGGYFDHTCEDNVSTLGWGTNGYWSNGVAMPFPAGQKTPPADVLAKCLPTLYGTTTT